MATLQSLDISNRVPIPGFGAGGGQLRCQTATITFPAVVTTSDALQFFYLPVNAVVKGGWLKSADLDSGTTVTINIGDAGDVDRYFAASNIGQAGGVTTVMAATGYEFRTTARTLVTGALAAGPSTTAGDVTLCIFYTVEEP